MTTVKADELIIEEWYAYSDAKEVDALAEWCESHGLEIECPERLKTP